MASAPSLMRAVRRPVNVVQEPERVSRLAMITAGAILGAFGLAMTLLFGLGLAGSLAPPVRPEWPGVLILVAIGLVAYFLCLVSWRLIANKPNRFQSIMGPLGWRFSAIVCLIAFGFLVWIAVEERDISLIGAMAGSLMLCIGSWRRAGSVRRL
jgi:hypothetical protein